MKKYFNVSFKYSDSVYCSNIAHAETAQDVKRHYSKYEWVNVTEAQEWEVETARKKSMPIVEIEKEENNMEFTEIKKAITEDAEKEKAKTAAYIADGYIDRECPECSRPDAGIERHSTETRWTQYKNGVISREKAVELATVRALKAIEKRTAAQLEKVDRIAAAPELEYISVSVEWVRSSVWGYNPRVEVRTNTGYYTGTASGCGYDKESAAVGEAFNACDSILKAVYTLKEKALRAGGTDYSKTAYCGRDNRTVCGYGAGYGAMPYFEGGVGVNCFWSILEKCGYRTRENHGKHSDFYSIEKEVA